MRLKEGVRKARKRQLITAVSEAASLAAECIKWSDLHRDADMSTNEGGLQHPHSGTIWVPSTAACLRLHVCIAFCKWANC